MSDEQSETTDAPVKRKGGRPPKAIKAPALSEDQFAQLLQVLAAGRDRGNGLDTETLKTALEGAALLSAQTMRKAMRPENETHPGVSVFSYPEGDVARPKKIPPFAFFYNGYPCSKFMETEHWREVELMNDVQPGEFTVIRMDGSKMTVSVTAERDADGQITKMHVLFPVSREEKSLVPPKATVLYQLVHAGTKAPKVLFVEGLNEWLQLTLGASDAVGV